jgi:hypothetical protein
MNTHTTIEELPFLCNSEVNTPLLTIEELLGNGAFCWAYPRIYNENLRSAEIEQRESLEAAVEGD